MRVLVCGGRRYGVGIENDQEKLNVFNALGGLHDRKFITALIEGGAAGADACGAAWAKLQNVDVLTFAADWEMYGPSAGPRRNQRMIDEGKPDLVVAFPGGKGTADMVRRAKAAGINVQEVQP